MPRLRILDATGDRVLDAPAYTQAEIDAEFNRLVKAGNLAYVVTDPVRKQGERITKFDPDAEEIVIHGPIAGG